MVEFQGIEFIVIDPPLLPVSPQDLAIVENQLGVQFPEDYRLFIVTLGAGRFEDIRLQALPPRLILEDRIIKLRKRLVKYWFWQDSEELLSQTRAIECIPCFDTFIGDDILFHPSNRTQFFVLPHEEKDILTFRSFLELCRHYANRRQLQPPFRFKPWSC